MTYVEIDGHFYKVETGEAVADRLIRRVKELEREVARLSSQVAHDDKTLRRIYGDHPELAAWNTTIRNVDA